MSLQSLATLCFVSVLLLSGSYAQELSKLHTTRHYTVTSLLCSKLTTSQEFLLHYSAPKCRSMYAYRWLVNSLATTSFTEVISDINNLCAILFIHIYIVKLKHTGLSVPACNF